MDDENTQIVECPHCQGRTWLWDHHTNCRDVCFTCGGKGTVIKQVVVIDPKTSVVISRKDAEELMRVVDGYVCLEQDVFEALRPIKDAIKRQGDENVGMD